MGLDSEPWSKYYIVTLLTSRPRGGGSDACGSCGVIERERRSFIPLALSNYNTYLITYGDKYGDALYPARSVASMLIADERTKLTKGQNCHCRCQESNSRPFELH